MIDSILGSLYIQNQEDDILSIGKKNALKKYDQFALNTSCFWRRTGSNITPAQWFYLLYRRQEYLYKWQMFILRSYSHLTKHAQMAEWIRRETMNQGIGGSIPLGRQFFFHLLKFFSRTVFWGCGGQRLIEKLVIDILMSAQHRSTYFHRKLRCWQMLR